MWGDVYALHGIFDKSLDAAIRHSMRASYGNKKDARLRKLAFQATSLLCLQGHDVATKRTNASGLKPQNQRKKPWTSHTSDINAMKSKSTSSSPAPTKDTFGKSVLAMGHAASQSSPTSSDVLLSLFIRDDRQS